MRKHIETWTVAELIERFSQISFPDYQREPNLWSLIEKQRLIDSIVRQFDIASLYFYEHDDGSLDCVDGRQRIGAILSFIGENPDNKDQGFSFRLLNEIYQDEDSNEFRVLADKRYSEIRQSEGIAQEFVDRLRNYTLSIVKLSDSREPVEFNLQFTRLNLGTILNAGEKLNAMVGDMRNECFGEGGLGSHEFLNSTRIPTRRFAREQVAAQILAQVFSLKEDQDYTRTRHFDLQLFFKYYNPLTPEQRELITKVRDLLDTLREPFEPLTVLRNRAITVSTVLLAWENGVTTEEQARQLAKFIEEFQNRLRWQIGKRLEIDEEYHHLLDFQRHLTQATLEKGAYVARARFLGEEYRFWQENNELTGDADWKNRFPERDPSAESRPRRHDV